MKIIDTYIGLEKVKAFGDTINELRKIYVTSDNRYFIERISKSTTLTEISEEDFISFTTGF